jgi:hypothetical protein
VNRLRPPLAVLLFALGASGTAVAGLAYGARTERAARASAKPFAVPVPRAEPELLDHEGPFLLDDEMDGSGFCGVRIPTLTRRRVAFEDALASRSPSAVALSCALRGLAEDQSLGGLWWEVLLGPFDSGAPRGTGEVRLTALAALAFLWTGHTDVDADRFGKHLSRALRGLKNAQRADGSFEELAPSPETDALATLALLEAYATTGNPAHLAPARAGLGNLARSGLAAGETGAATWSSLVFDVAREVVRDEIALLGRASLEIPAEGPRPASKPVEGVRVPDGVLAAIAALRAGGAAGDAWADVFERLALTQEVSGDEHEPRGTWHGRHARGPLETTATFALLLAAPFRWAPEPRASGSASGR